MANKAEVGIAPPLREGWCMYRDERVKGRFAAAVLHG